MLAIRDDRDFVTQDDFMKGARKLQEAKKLETSSVSSVLSLVMLFLCADSISFLPLSGLCSSIII